MPMLPSGRHIALNREPFQDLLDDAQSVAKVHRLIGIHEKPDIYPFTDVLWLVPDDQATPEQFDAVFLDGSLPRPPGLTPVRSGYRISQFDEFSAAWSSEDKTAFWDFIHGRADHLFDEALQLAIAAQQRLRADAVGAARLMILWWDAGVHPAQESPPAVEGELPVWDTYDMLAALGQMLESLNMIEVQETLLDDRMRLAALWSVYAHELAPLRGWPGLSIPPRQAAQKARHERWLDAMDESSRSTLHRQCVYECVTLWDHLGDHLSYVFPDPARIIELVVVSADANEVFDR
ncbi:hypothetical protein [Rhodoferax sp.]|uniref:hypothetical protein n=1 Tax=Rhodoferax sp. TaxID=50421 RepID=UPI002765C731|nr:hypothetical protein [Rhodoferax sp.]